MWIIVTDTQFVNVQDALLITARPVFQTDLAVETDERPAPVTGLERDNLLSATIIEANLGSVKPRIAYIRGDAQHSHRVDACLERIRTSLKNKDNACDLREFNDPASLNETDIGGQRYSEPRVL